jgi:ABC-type bacteriocin/lantibiotic exporter with double-glycine peptidase domain
VVMQDDQLLSGSIADNICFFDERFELEHMMRCAELAGIHEEICRMPMAYNSLIGDMHASLSGGQKQRVPLARALYRRPRLLFMDEGTSHLDIATERQVHRLGQGARADPRHHCAPAGNACLGAAGWCCTTAKCMNCRRVLLAA